MLHARWSGSAAVALIAFAACGEDVTFSGTSGAASSGATGVATTGAGGAGGEQAGVGGSSATGTSSATASAATTGPTTTVGSTATVGAGGGPACEGLGDPCTDCAAAQCPAVYCECAFNPECGLVIQCLQGCMGDAACAQVCFTAHEDGISDAFLLGNCSATTCSMSCPNAPNPLNDCRKCRFEQCEVESNACLANPECQALIACVGGCNGDPACGMQCAAQHQGGIADAQALRMCATANCSMECG